jgi:hypothetical protein
LIGRGYRPAPIARLIAALYLFLASRPTGRYDDNPIGGVFFFELRLWSEFG